jgi:hypothetical protein
MVEGIRPIHPGVEKDVIDFHYSNCFYGALLLGSYKPPRRMDALPEVGRYSVQDL